MLASTRQAPLKAAASCLRLSQISASPLLEARYNALQTPYQHSARRSLHSTPIRSATHGAQGRANGPKNGAGKRLGAKKTGDEQVIPGNIIFRQRGTKWFPGENVGMGRDHTIFALQPGYVKYYSDPRGSHPKRRYIGVVFERTQALPTPLNAARRRRLGMVAVQRADVGIEQQGVGAEMGLQDAAMVQDVQGEVVAPAMAASLAGSAPGSGMTKSEAREAKRKAASGRVPGQDLTMRGNYSYRESNYEIGRAAERAGVQVNEFRKGDRFMAWRKTGKRRARAAEKRAIGKSVKGKGAKGKKK